MFAVFRFFWILGDEAWGSARKYAENEESLHHTQKPYSHEYGFASCSRRGRGSALIIHPARDSVRAALSAIRSALSAAPPSARPPAGPKSSAVDSGEWRVVRKNSTMLVDGGRRLAAVVEPEYCPSTSSPKPIHNRAASGWTEVQWTVGSGEWSERTARSSWIEAAAWRPLLNLNTAEAHAVRSPSTVAQPPAGPKPVWVTRHKNQNP